MLKNVNILDSDGNFITSKIKTGGSRADLVRLNPGQDFILIFIRV